jgi:hypothetical protein
MPLTNWIAGTLVAVAPLLAGLTPHQGRPVAVVVSPWSNPSRASEVAAAAGGLLLGPTSASWITIAVFDQPDLVTRLWRHGAWLSVDAAAAETCLRASLE